MTRLLVDMVTDVVCPWCYVGLKSLLKARETLAPDHETIIRLRPYQLNPGTPIEGVDRERYYAAKFPDAERLAAIRAQIVEGARAAGFAFDPKRPKRLPNTLLAHVAMRAAQLDGFQEPFAQALYAAYWDEDADIGAAQTLGDIGARVGMNRDRLLDRLADPGERETVGAEADAMRDAGVSGVPTFIVNERRGFSGALPPDRLAAAIKGAAQLAMETTS